MIVPQERILEALLRSDFLSFARRVFRELNPGRTFYPSWAHEAIAHHLCVVAINKDYNRLIINLPPRSAKSTIASVALPAYLLGRDPTARIVAVSYNQELATLFSRHTRQVMQSHWYKKLFPSTRLPTRAAEDNLYTSAGGYRLSTSTSGTLTGKGGDLVIIDDPLKADDAYSETAREASQKWARSTLYTRIDNKSAGAVILVQQRQHEDDMSGIFLRTGNWLHLNLPAIAEKDERILLSNRPLRFHDRKEGDVLDPDREPMSILMELKSEMGIAAFSAQYLQAPMPPDGDVIKLSWFMTYDDIPDGGETILSIDTASKAGLRNDWSVISAWRVIDEHFYLMSVWRQRVEFPVLKRCVIEHAQRLRPDRILIEDKGSGIGLIQELQAESGYFPVVAFNPGTYDKETRMRIQSAKIEAGHVWLPPEAPWLEEFQNEVRRFPNGSHDDQIDAMSQILNWMSDSRGSLIIRRYQ